MSSLGRYTEIPRESSFIPSQSSRGFRKMSCFDSQEEDQPRTTKKTFSTNSLPKLNKSSTAFEVTRFPTEELAAQLTHIDSELFAKIDLEELTSCGWIKKNKQQIAPNIVAYTRRFNHVSFWTVEEILNQDTPKGRAEVISYFLKVSKRLYDLNNLQSLFAIISALRSASLYRLSQTWSFLTKKEKQCVDKYADLFSDQDNFAKLREHMDALKIPCVPYIGIYLTDLVYLSMANPSCNLKENLSANNIFRIISTYQTESSYSHLPKDNGLISQLRSVRFIDELLKFVEDDNYKKSLVLEPPSDEPSPLKYTPSQKKWGNKPKLPEDESTSVESLRNLIDDSLLEKGDEVEPSLHASLIEHQNRIGDVILEGCLRRKTLLKNGKKPRMSSWQRYWIQLWGSVLVYYSAKSLTGTNRSDFKYEPCKMKSVIGWLIQVTDDPLHPDSVHLANPTTGTMYKFRTGSSARALVWCRKIQECQKKRNRPANLIKFD